jgi:hypothetical protein
MRIAVVGHSMIHIRQQKFFQEVAKLGHDVLVISPEIWHGGQTAKPERFVAWKFGLKYQDDCRIHSQSSAETHYELRPLVGVAPDENYGPGDFTLMGLKDVLKEFEPDWVYVQQEPGSKLLDQVNDMTFGLDDLSFRLAIFTWENIEIKNPVSMYRADLIVCGNDRAQTMVAFQADTIPNIILPQVGVDVDHFQAREVARDIDVAYIGRQAAEKGVVQLKEAWPATRFLEWTPYLELPWKYSQTKLVVCYSQDTDYWREQAMPYVAMEAICCGAAAIVSDAGSIPFWVRRFAGTNRGTCLVAQNDTADLKRAIEDVLLSEKDREALVSSGRQWVEENLSSKVIARRLVDEFEKHA